MPNYAPALLMLACSQSKLSHSAPAIDLYRGVMYRTYRANVQRCAEPHVVILSAEHGFLSADTLVAPYEKRMSTERADQMVARIGEHLPPVWPRDARHVLLAGGRDYLRVMRAAVQTLKERGALPADCSVRETTGGIGYQRQQLGEFLRGLPAQQGVIGHHPNGVPLYREMGGFKVEQPIWIAYRGRPDLAPVSGVIDELFIGPEGPTACVRIKDPARGPREHPEWVDLRNLKPR